MIIYLLLWDDQKVNGIKPYKIISGKDIFDGKFIAIKVDNIAIIIFEI
jgi:hypothetical protein